MSISHIPIQRWNKPKGAQEFNNTLVVLLEKIHGTNFSMIYNQDGEC